MHASGALNLQWTAARLPPNQLAIPTHYAAFDSLCDDPACNPCCAPQNSSTERLKQFVLMEPLIVKPRIPVSALHWLVVHWVDGWL